MGARRQCKGRRLFESLTALLPAGPGRTAMGPRTPLHTGAVRAPSRRGRGSVAPLMEAKRFTLSLRRRSFLDGGVKSAGADNANGYRRSPTSDVSRGGGCWRNVKAAMPAPGGAELRVRQIRARPGGSRPRLETKKRGDNVRPPGFSRHQEPKDVEFRHLNPSSVSWSVGQSARGTRSSYSMSRTKSLAAAAGLSRSISRGLLHGAPDSRRPKSRGGGGACQWFVSWVFSTWLVSDGRHYNKMCTGARRRWKPPAPAPGRPSFRLGAGDGSPPGGPRRCLGTKRRDVFPPDIPRL